MAQACYSGLKMVLFPHQNAIVMKKIGLMMNHYLLYPLNKSLQSDAPSRRAAEFNRQALMEMKTYFCWRCDKDMPFLEESEWNQVSPLLEGAIQAIKDYREEHDCDLATAKDN